MAQKMVPCKTCGEMIAKSAKVCPHCGAKQKKHIWLGVLLAVFGLALLGSALSGGTNSKTPKLVVESSARTDVTPEPTRPTAFGVGDKAELNNVIVTLVSVNTSNGSSYNKPADGNEFVLCEFEIENNTGSDIAVSSLVSFTAYFDDYSSNLSFSAMGEKGNQQQLDGTIAGGKKMRGVVGYEAAKDWKEMNIEFKAGFWDGKKFSFVATHP